MQLLLNEMCNGCICASGEHSAAGVLRNSCVLDLFAVTADHCTYSFKKTILITLFYLKHGV